MRAQFNSRFRFSGGFTLVEVAVATALVVTALTGIYAMQAQTLQVIRSARDSSAASQVLQQRVEQLRMSKYSTVVRASGLIGLMNGTAGATDSELEMRSVRNFRESVTIATYGRPGVSPQPASRLFTVVRSNNTATCAMAAEDLRSESLIKARFLVTWDDRTGSHRREFSTILTDFGVSSAGISARPLAESGSDSPGKSPPRVTATPVPAPDAAQPPTAPPSTCRHGRKWPHCGQR